MKPSYRHVEDGFKEADVSAAAESAVPVPVLQEPSDSPIRMLDALLGVSSHPSSARKSFYNYIAFCVLYSTTHATVDAVLSFSAAELGSVLGRSCSTFTFLSYGIIDPRSLYI
jgi:hypothetical protein